VIAEELGRVARLAPADRAATRLRRYRDPAPLA
jgi:hypothetical protein